MEADIVRFVGLLSAPSFGVTSACPLACHFPGAFLEFLFILPGLVTYPTHASDGTLHPPALLFLLPLCSNTGLMGRIGKNSECLNTEWTLSNYTGFSFF